MRLALAVAFILGATVIVFAFALLGRGASSQGCPSPQYIVGASNFQIVASVDGFNGSALAPYSSNGTQRVPWPVIQVTKGSEVSITVCNVDKQAHGFQIAHYYDSSIFTVAPGQSIRVTFVADQAGTFRVYCSILCSIHWAMQDGELEVT
jgi:FtsP/CotA-like multicopper oxidase with cupredoxin domain